MTDETDEKNYVDRANCAVCNKLLDLDKPVLYTDEYQEFYHDNDSYIEDNTYTEKVYHFFCSTECLIEYYKKEMVIGTNSNTWKIENHVRHTEKCKICDGSGKVYYKGLKVECHDCYGSGYE
jgi:hypothetical protein